MLFDFLAFFSVYLVAGTAVIILFASVYKSSHAEIKVFTLAMLFKLACTYYYYVFTLSNPADALGYSGYAKAHGFVPSVWALFQTGTNFINNVSDLFYPLVSFFDNQYLMLYIPFSLLGFYGSLLFYRTLRLIAPANRKLELYAVSFFLPNMVFWTSNLGKDSLIYLGITLVMFGFMAKPKPPKNIIAICLGGWLIFSVRPHIFLFMLFGFLLGLFMEKRPFSFRSVFLFLVIFAAFLFTQQTMLKLVGMQPETDDQQPVSISSYYAGGVSKVETSSRNLNIGGSATGSAHKFKIVFFPYYLVTFLASPFMWQAKKPIQFVSALETVIYQLMILYLCIHWKDVMKIRFIRYKYSWLLYLIVASIIVGAAQTNFGLIVRQRCMVLPVIFILFTGLRRQLLETKKKKPRKQKADLYSAFYKKALPNAQA
jgi:hypothetical protein